jgi:hypothetical protein
MKDMNKVIKLKETTAKDLKKSFNERKKEYGICEFGCGNGSRYIIRGIECCSKYEYQCSEYARYIIEKKMMLAGQVPHRKMKDTKFSCFKNLFFQEEWYIKNIIGLVEWGSNRVIRQQGFRVLPITEDLKPIKQWDRITDPNFVINKSMYLSKPKAQSIIVVHIGELPNETR